MPILSRCAPVSALPDPLAAMASFRATGERAARAVATGHPCVVLLGTPAETAPLLDLATASLAHGHTVLHAVPAERFSPTDLVRPGEAGVLVIADAERLGRAALLALDAHLKRAPRAAPRARLLLAATSGLREQTAFPDLLTLHRAALLVDPPTLTAAEQAALLTAIAPALDAGGRAAVTRLAAGDPALLLALVRRGRRARLVARVAAAPLTARAMAHPLGLALASCLLLAAALTLAVERVPPPPAPELAASPPPALPAPPAIPNAGASVETADPGATPPDDGVLVDHENPEQAAAEAAAHMPRMVTALPGETLAAMSARVYRGITSPPPPASLEAVNPFPPVAGARLVFPAPRAGWPRS